MQKGVPYGAPLCGMCRLGMCVHTKKGIPRKGNALVAYRLEGSVVSFLRFLLPIPARVLAQYVYMRVRA
ncbi:MAG: hypothetical protein DBX55_02535 [Verrucomicrobia bacterium]|nr:MAG: hypothetical protein DBX55_02535 [Verrucomicrobiota bacterium]